MKPALCMSSDGPFQILGASKAKLIKHFESIESGKAEQLSTAGNGDQIWCCRSNCSETRKVQTSSGNPYEEKSMSKVYTLKI